jgi:gluconolactonase
MKILARSLLVAALVAGASSVDAARGDEPGMPSTVAKDAQLVELYAADAFFEGPVWHPGTGKLFFTLHKGSTNQVLRLDAPGKVTVWMDKSEGVGGMFQSPDGRILATQAYGHRLLSFAVGEAGPEDVKVLHHEPKWNQPNDLCRVPGGDVYFTDPDFKNRKTSAVYRWSNGEASKVLDDMAVPNGIAASLDGNTLYVSDSHHKHWRAYPVRDDGTAGEGRVFFDPATDNRSNPDGMSIDEHGNLYFTGRGGVWVVDPRGKALGLIKTPTFISNVTLGGADGKTLYLVGSGKVYSIQLSVRCAPFARP